MNEREKRMLILLGIIAFLGGNFLLYGKYKNKITFLSDEKIKLVADNNVKDEILKEGITWESTNTWFHEHPVKQSTAEDAQNTLLNDVRTAAENTKLVLNIAKPIRFLTPIESPPYTRIRVSIDFSSPSRGFIEWITQMNDPAQFRTVTNLNMKPSRDKTLVEVSANVEQWILPQAAVIDAPTDTEHEPADNKDTEPPLPSES